MDCTGHPCFYVITSYSIHYTKLYEEKFQFSKVGTANGHDVISIKGSNGRYVSSENGASAMTCNRTAAGTWEKFELVVITSYSIHYTKLYDIKHLYLNGMKPTLSDVTQTTAPSTVTLGAGATMVLCYDYASNVTINQTSNEYRITSYNVCYTKLLRGSENTACCQPE